VFGPSGGQRQGGPRGGDKKEGEKMSGNAETIPRGYDLKGWDVEKRVSVCVRHRERWRNDFLNAIKKRKGVAPIEKIDAIEGILKGRRKR